MTVEAKLEYVDDAHMRILGATHILREIYEKYTEYVPGYRFMPLYKKGVWDGKLRFFNSKDGMMYAGLRHEIEDFLNQNHYSYEVDQRLCSQRMFGDEQVREYIESLELPEHLVPRDFQISAFANSVREKRRINVMPTGSGKSLSIYMLSKFYKKTLIIVNNLLLIEQMRDDFISYGCDPNDIHTIFSGKDKNSDCHLTVSTWQSISRLKSDFFNQFETIVGDEVHTFSASSLITIMKKANHVANRFGFSGTLSDAQVDLLTLRGLFGEINQEVTTRELIDRGILSDIRISLIQLKYKLEDCKKAREFEWRDELEFLANNEARNRFIVNLAISQKKNTLILVSLIEKHGNVLYDMLKKELGDSRNVYYIHGGVKGDARNEIRKTLENEENAILVASRQTTSTGINIKRLHSVIFASPLASKISNLQSIGRGLRLHSEKDFMMLYDIADDLRSRKFNITWRHMQQRLDTYQKEDFQVKIYPLKLEP